MGRVLIASAGLLGLAASLSGCLRDANTCAADGDCATALMCVQGDCVPREGGTDVGADAAPVDGGELPDAAQRDAGATDGGDGEDAGGGPCCVLAQGAFAGPADITLSSEGNVRVVVVDLESNEVAVFSFDDPRESASRSSFELGRAGLSSVSLASDDDGGSVLSFEDSAKGWAMSSVTSDGEAWEEPEAALTAPTGPTVSHQHITLSPWKSSYGVMAFEVTDEDIEQDTNYGVVPVFGRLGISGANPSRLGTRDDTEAAILDTALTRRGRDLLTLWSYDGRTVEAVMLDEASNVGAPFAIHTGATGEFFSGGLRAIPDADGTGAWITFLMDGPQGTNIEVVGFDGVGQLTSLPRPTFPDGITPSEPALMAGRDGAVHLVYHAISTDSRDTSELTVATWTGGSSWSYDVLDPDTGGSGVALGAWDIEDGGMHVVYTHGAGEVEDGALEYVWFKP